MSERAPYSRVYWSILQDPKFDGIRSDMRHVGTWTVLLMVADMAWPAPAYLPPVVSKASVVALANAGIVDALPDGMFRIHGLDAERGRRRDAARTPTKRDPNGTQTGSGRYPNGPLDETRRDEHRQDETSNARDEQWMTAWLMVRHRIPTPRQRDFIDSYLRAFELTGDERAEGIILAHPDDPIAAMKLDLESARAERLGIAKSQEAASRAIPKRKREPWQDEYAALIEASNAPGVS